MDNLINLAFQRVVVGFMVIAQRKHGDSRHKIQIFFPVHIVEVHAFPLIKYDLITVVGVKQRLLRLIYITLHFRTHFSAFFLYIFMYCETLLRSILIVQIV